MAKKSHNQAQAPEAQAPAAVTLHTQPPAPAQAAAMLAAGAPAVQVAAVALGHTVVPAAPSKPALVVPPVYFGVAGTALTKSQLAIANAKGGATLAPGIGALGPLVVNAAKPYAVRTNTNAAWWQACVAAMQQGGGTATAAQMVAAGAPPTFVAYCINKGRWLVPA